VARKNRKKKNNLKRRPAGRRFLYTKNHKKKLPPCNGSLNAKTKEYSGFQGSKMHVLHTESFGVSLRGFCSLLIDTPMHIGCPLNQILTPLKLLSNYPVFCIKNCKKKAMPHKEAWTQEKKMNQKCKIELEAYRA